MKHTIQADIVLNIYPMSFVRRAIKIEPYARVGHRWAYAILVISTKT